MSNEEKETSVILVIVSVLCPIVGWILWGVKKNSAYGSLDLLVLASA